MRSISDLKPPFKWLFQFKFSDEVKPPPSSTLLHLLYNHGAPRCRCPLVLPEEPSLCWPSPTCEDADWRERFPTSVDTQEQSGTPTGDGGEEEGRRRGGEEERGRGGGVEEGRRGRGPRRTPPNPTPHRPHPSQTLPLTDPTPPHPTPPLTDPTPPHPTPPLKDPTPPLTDPTPQRTFLNNQRWNAAGGPLLRDHRRGTGTRTLVVLWSLNSFTRIQSGCWTLCSPSNAQL
ncbi:hypothetical protein EYF80_061992 [Liparis tanakae]|uniref:Uncharacterized protein n=1 Tax=Liparis tanakae TaxID=230148 RepID=A0A4Z2EG43_9TELE|nr:hypothetical protein EYF80_061992 [Liparis tanakae]